MTCRGVRGRPARHFSEARPPPDEELPELPELLEPAAAISDSCLTAAATEARAQQADGLGRKWNARTWGATSAAPAERPDEPLSE